MKKKFLLLLNVFAIVVLFNSISIAQNECDCPEPTDSDAVCVVQEIYDWDSTYIGVDTFLMPSECYALCWGFTEDQIIGNCDLDWTPIDTTWNECDCPEPTENDAVCVVGDIYLGDSVIYVQDTFWMPSECYALCWGYTEDQIIGNCGIDSSYTYASLTATKDVKKEMDLSNISLYPNPVDNYFYIDLSGIKSSNFHISITGVDGRILYTKSINNNNELRIDASNYLPGIYIVNIRSNNSNKTLRLIKI